MFNPHYPACPVNGIYPSVVACRCFNLLMGLAGQKRKKNEEKRFGFNIRGITHLRHTNSTPHPPLPEDTARGDAHTVPSAARQCGKLTDLFPLNWQAGFFQIGFRFITLFKVSDCARPVFCCSLCSVCRLSRTEIIDSVN